MRRIEEGKEIIIIFYDVFLFAFEQLFPNGVIYIY
jgi:hypothetical protein